MIITFGQSVASSSATADIAYYICIVSFFVAGGVAIYLLLDKIKEHNTAPAKKARIVKPTKIAAKKPAVKKSAAKKAAVKKPAVKKTVAKKPVKRVAKTTAKKK